MAQSSTFNLGERSRREGGGPPEQGGGIADRLTELEAEVGELERMLARSHRLVTLGTIVASIAHELNNILTPVMSYAELAQQHPDDAGLRDRAMSRIASGVSRASGITSAILAFAGARGAEGGGLACDVGEAVESAMRCMARDPASDGIDVRVDVPCELTAAMDQTALSHIVLNLILNARRAMKKGGGRLTIRAWRGGKWNETPAGMEGGGWKESPRPSEAKGRIAEGHRADRQLLEEQISKEQISEDQISEKQDSECQSLERGMSEAPIGCAWAGQPQECSRLQRMDESSREGPAREAGGTPALPDASDLSVVPRASVVVEVRDTGCGMDAGVLAGLFRPFASSREGKGGGPEIEGGTGLGLAICARLVSAVGGRMVVWSKVGGGTVFRVVIPAS